MDERERKERAHLLLTRLGEIFRQRAPNVPVVSCTFPADEGESDARIQYQRGCNPPFTYSRWTPHDWVVDVPEETWALLLAKAEREELRRTAEPPLAKFLEKLNV